jgi:outer membrane biogenesis lipoprotein LolB
MTRAKAIGLLLALLALLGCASQLQRSSTSPTIAEKADEEQQQKSRLPTITYRPGG